MSSVLMAVEETDDAGLVALGGEVAGGVAVVVAEGGVGAGGEE